MVHFSPPVVERSKDDDADLNCGLQSTETDYRQQQLEESHALPEVQNSSGDEAGLDCGLQPTDADFREQKLLESHELPKEQRGWRKLIRNFTPSRVHLDPGALS